MSINKKEEQSEVNSDYSTNDDIFSLLIMQKFHIIHTVVILVEK